MATIFKPGNTAQRGDLDIFLLNTDEEPVNAYEISFALYFVDPSGPVEVLIGSATRVPANPTMGEYFAPFMVPGNATEGTYRIKWTFQQYSNSPSQQVVQEFSVIASDEAAVRAYDAGTQALIDDVRILLRDQDPDAFYHFRPPEHEGRLGNYNRVFGQIWRDNEIKVYLERALDWWNMFPPSTNIHSLSLVVSQYPAWRTAMEWQAIVHACFALASNSVSDEFSLKGDSIVSIYADGQKFDLPISELHGILKNV